MRQYQMLFRAVVVSLILLTSVNYALAQRKPRVAVLDFSGHPEGKRIADWAVVKLGESKTYTLLVRDDDDFARVMREISLNQAEFNTKAVFDKDAKVQIGRVKGVEILVMGMVDTYKVSRPKLDLMMRAAKIPGGNIPGSNTTSVTPSRGKWNASVKLLFKMVNAATTEIMDSSTVEGKASGSDLTSIMDGKVDADFEKELLNRATLDAVGKFVVKLEQKASGLQMPDEPVAANPQPDAPEKSSTTPTRSVETTAPPESKTVTPATPPTTEPPSPTEGTVLDVEGNVVSIHFSNTAGMRSGDRWKIRRVRKEVKDAAGNVVGKLFDDIGEVVITEVQPQMIVGKYTGAKPAQQNDYAVKITNVAPAASNAPSRKVAPRVKKP
jgi:curli biogenesis system outer membrane secretion channel CsgG